MMVTVPYYRMNYLLLNCKRKVYFEFPDECCYSFKEYIKSQIHFAVTPILFNRDLKDYKDVYCFLEEGKYVENEVLSRVLKYFYEDLYNSFKISQMDKTFYLDYTGIESRYPVKIIPNGESMGNKLLALNQARMPGQESYLLIIGGSIDD